MRRESNQRMADFAVADVSLFWLLNALNSAEPVLAFNAHDGLVQRLDTLLLQLRAKCQRLMAMRRESNQRMADFAVADVSLFWLLNALNSAEPVL
ncbi:type VI secretion system baseplate subunit TssK, partial [Enterobacter hormaechei]|uniref:type VI secretion system baseplate subunit TssK n=1 Tax=Enterobacter hormaechei TaxID=158836 RepID=UPI0013FE018B